MSGVIEHTEASEASPLSPESHPSDPTRLERGLVWLLAFVAIAGLKWWTLSMPANWDEVWAVLPGGLWLADNGFDIIGLLRQGGYNQYGPATHGASPVTWLAGLAFLLAPAGRALPALHWVHFAIGAVAIEQLYRFASGAWRRPAAAAFAASMIIVPVISAQLGAVYLEIPLLAATALAANAYVRGRLPAAAGWAALATAIKPTGIFVAMAIGLDLLARDRTWRGALRGFLYGLPSLGIVAYHLLAITGSSPDRTLGAGQSILASLITALTINEWSIALILSILAAVALRRPLPAALRDRVRFSLALEVAFVIMFVIVPLVGLRDRLLPRYVVAVLPFAAFAAVAAIHRVYGKRLTAVLVSLMIGMMLVNQTGALFARRDVPNVVLQERTNAYADLLLLQRDLLNLGIERPEPLMVVAPNHYFRARQPELGYVDSIPSKVVDVGHVPFDPDDPDTYPDEFLVFDSESYPNATKDFIARIEEDPRFEIEEIERSRGRFTLKLLVVRRTE